MGLPFFVTPVEPDVSYKAIEKMAATPRSAIRRQAPPRRSTGGRAPQERRHELLSRRIIPGRNVENDDLDSARRSPPPRGHDIPGDVTHAQHRQALVEGMTAVRDALSFERQHPPDAQSDRPSMPPVPESRDFPSTEEAYREIERFRQARHQLRRMARRHPAPTPPYTEADLATHPHDASALSYTPTDLSSPRLRLQNNQDIPPALANARRSLDEEIQARHSPYISTSSPLGRPSLSERVQTLTRLSADVERSNRLLRQARLDGLGDRDRSLSPDGGAAWETLSIGIAPDPQPPSAASSFASTSAAAAATSSSSNTNQTSASTAMTSNWTDCVLSDVDSTDDDEEEEEMFDLQEFNRTRNDHFWRTHAGVVTARAYRAVGNSVGIGEAEHLGGMHRIISRLAERDDIPDEWWAGAGLSRNLRRERTG